MPISTSWSRWRSRSALSEGAAGQSQARRRQEAKSDRRVRRAAAADGWVCRYVVNHVLPDLVHWVWNHCHLPQRCRPHLYHERMKHLVFEEAEAVKLVDFVTEHPGLTGKEVWRRLEWKGWDMWDVTSVLLALSLRIKPRLRAQAVHNGWRFYPLTATQKAARATGAVTPKKAPQATKKAL